MARHVAPADRRDLVGRFRHRAAERAVVTLVDQVVSSASNFLLGMLIARASGADGLGTFGIAFLVWLAVVGLNRALVTEPMTVGDATGRAGANLPEGLLSALVVGLVAATGIAAVGVVMHLAGVGTAALLAVAVWIPSLLAQDYCRSMAFRLRRPDQALLSDAAFAVVQVASSLALYLGGVRSTAAFISAWGLGATVGAIVGVRLLRIRPTVRGAVPHLRALWPRSRWFVAEFGTSFPADQGYLLLLPVLLGTAQFGYFRAGMGLIGPVVVVFIAGGNIGLPESVRRLREGGAAGLRSYARSLTAVVLAVTVVYCGLVAALAEPVLRVVYGAEFAPAATVTRLIALQYVLMAVSFGFGQAVKAAGRMRQLWLGRAVSAALSILAVVVLTAEFGLVGAGVASVTAGLAYSTGVLVVHHRMHRSGALAPREQVCR